jgi:hypothetical protein
MVYLESSWFVWGLGIVQFAGLVSAWLTRLSEGSRGQSSCHCLFFACLALIGVATLLSVSLGMRTQLFCCLTLSIMVLTAVSDFSAEARARRI